MVGLEFRVLNLLVPEVLEEPLLAEVSGLFDSVFCMCVTSNHPDKYGIEEGFFKGALP